MSNTFDTDAFDFDPNNEREMYLLSASFRAGSKLNVIGEVDGSLTGDAGYDIGFRIIITKIKPCLSIN